MLHMRPYIFCRDSWLVTKISKFLVWHFWTKTTMAQHNGNLTLIRNYAPVAVHPYNPDTIPITKIQAQWKCQVLFQEEYLQK